MAKFKNKKTGQVIEVDLLYYVNQLRNNPDYKEIKEKESKKDVSKEVVEDKPLQ